jgi:ribonuclease D
LIAALEAAEPMSADELPAREPQRPGLSSEGALIADLLKLLLKIRAKEAGVAPRLIVRADDLELLAAGQRKGLGMLDGWRRDIFGADALALVEGRLGFAVAEGKLKLTRVSDD